MLHIIILYIVVSTVTTSLTMMQLVKGCINPMYDSFKMPVVNMVYSMLMGWLMFVPLLCVMAGLLRRMWLNGVTWEMVWRELDDYDNDDDK